MSFHSEGRAGFRDKDIWYAPLMAPNKIVVDQVRVILQTKMWLETVVVGFGFCPFASREMDHGRVRYSVIPSGEVFACLQSLLGECRLLDENSSIETALLVFPCGFDDFKDFLALLDLAEKLLVDQAYGGTYQLASFHPLYCFANSTEEDAANYTNRSPYPMLHLLREDSVAKALATFSNPETIPGRNIEFARAFGKENMKAMLAACYALEK